MEQHALKNVNNHLNTSIQVFYHCATAAEQFYGYGISSANKIKHVFNVCYSQVLTFATFFLDGKLTGSPSLLKKQQNVQIPYFIKYRVHFLHGK
jgi:hypothetical protein